MDLASALISTIPVHSKLNPQLRFQDEYLTSCSFDGNDKVWSTRVWKGLAALRGHAGKVMGMGVLDFYFVCLFVCWVICFQSQKNPTVF